MNVYINRITGIDDAITALYISNGHWTRDLEISIRNLHDEVTDRCGRLHPDADTNKLNEYNYYMDKLIKWGVQHITLLRFIDVSILVDGLHRGGQDDWDSHAQRFNNRIVRLSTRIKSLDTKPSDFYQDKIVPTDVALAHLGIVTPDLIVFNGQEYVRCQNGYVLKSHEKDPDVLRGLYMLSLSSTFLFKINLAEWGHVYKLRNSDGHANPEVQELCETIADQLLEFQPQFTRSLFKEIQN